MGGIDWLFGAVLAGFLARGVCRGLLVESLTFFGLLGSAALGAPGPFSLLLAGAGHFLQAAERAGLLMMRNLAPVAPPGRCLVPGVRPA